MTESEEEGDDVGSKREKREKIDQVQGFSFSGWLELKLIFEWRTEIES